MLYASYKFVACKAIQSGFLNSLLVLFLSLLHVQFLYICIYAP